MNIQGDLFTDYYIPDFLVVECYAKLLSIPAITSVVIDPDCDEVYGYFVLTVYALQQDFNDTYDICKSIQDTINAQLHTEIYFLVEMQEW